MIRLAPFLMVSLLIHGFVLCAHSPWANTTNAPGHQGAPDDRVFVSLEAETESLASAPTPSTVDSARSQESTPQKRAVNEPQPKAPSPAPPEQPDKAPISHEARPSESVLAVTADKPAPNLDVPEEMRSEAEEVAPPKEPQTVDDKPALTEQTPAKKPPKEENKEDRSQADAPKSVASVAQVASNRSSFRSTRGHELVDFKAKVIAAIRAASYYPKKAARSKKHGKVVVKFRIWKEGKVDNIVVVSSSGAKILDEAAVTILEKAAEDFPKVPASFRGDHLTYAAPIVFKAKSGRTR